MKEQKSEIIIYQNPDGLIKIDVMLQDETVWLTQAQMAVLFDKGRSTITEHIQNVFSEGELDENSVCRKFRHTADNDKIFKINFYNCENPIEFYGIKIMQGLEIRERKKENSTEKWYVGNSDKPLIC